MKISGDPGALGVPDLLQRFFGLPLLGYVTRYLGETAQPPLLVFERRDEHARPESGAVPAHLPALFLVSPFIPRYLQLALGLPALDVLLGIEDREVPPQYLLLAIALDAVRSFVPAGHPPFGVQHKDRVVFHALYQQPESLLAPAYLFLGPLALCDVVGSGVDETLFDHRDGFPRQPDVGAVFAAVTILEVDGRGARGELLHLFDGRHPVIGMHELDERFREQLPAGIAERSFERGVRALKVPVQTGDAEQVEREREDAVPLLFGPLLPTPVPRDADDANRATLRVVDQGVSDVRGEGGAVLAPGHEVGLPRRSGPDPFHDRVGDLGFHGTDGQLHDVAAQRFLSRPAVELLGVLVPVRHHAPQIGGDDRGPDLLEQTRLKQRLLLRPLTGGYVLDHRQCARRPPLLVSDELRAHAHPHHPTVLAHVALLDRVLRLISPYHQSETLQVLLAVLGVRDLGERHAEQLRFGIAGDPA